MYFTIHIKTILKSFSVKFRRK